jgi:hypothetical protein
MEKHHTSELQQLEGYVFPIIVGWFVVVILFIIISIVTAMLWKITGRAGVLVISGMLMLILSVSIFEHRFVQLLEWVVYKALGKHYKLDSAKEPDWNLRHINNRFFAIVLLIIGLMSFVRALQIILISR